MLCGVEEERKGSILILGISDRDATTHSGRFTAQGVVDSEQGHCMSR